MHNRFVPDQLIFVEAYVKPPELPIKKGDVVRVPKGTEVHSYHPGRKCYVTKRAQTIHVDHTLRGRSITVREALGEYRTKLKQNGIDLSLLEEWRDQNKREFYSVLVLLDEPTIRWPGTGGYWCEVPIKFVEKINE